MNEEFLTKWKSQVKKGTLAFVLLSLLKDGEKYGYEIAEEVMQATSIHIAEGTLYPLLNRLKDEGLVCAKWVEQASGIPRKYYSLTPDGEETFRQMQVFWTSLNDSIQTLSK
jgi:PadR family transcriptional regulator PadR